MRKEAMIAKGDAHARGVDIEDEERYLEGINPEIPQVNGDADKSDE